MTFILGFWIGLGTGVGGYWLYSNPDKRAAVVARIKALIKR